MDWNIRSWFQCLRMKPFCVDVPKLNSDQPHSNSNRTTNNKKSIIQTPTHPPSTAAGDQDKCFWAKLFFYLSWKSFCSIKTTSTAALFTLWIETYFTLYRLSSEFGCQVKLYMNRLYYMHNQDLAVLINSLLNLQLQNLNSCTWD